MNEYEAKQCLDDAEMRRGLWVYLWQFRQDAKHENHLPYPLLRDEDIEEELKRILLPPRKKFLGIF
ncbi:MAG: hypothetical protein WC998_01350 [Candidatus Paceibacterota bacterium]